MTHQDIRKKYIEFFVNKCNHKEIPSAPLVPENDPSTLFTSSGMQPLIPYLLGETHPLGKRLVNSQKSFRSQDIEEVGDNRHTTFFEMLGNWSLGDYFKKEQIPWFFEFLTQVVGLPKEKLAVSCFEGNESVPKDTESYEIWKKLGIAENRIFFYGTKKNWWSRSGVPEIMPPGEPGGPDSEVFFEFTDIPHDPTYGEKCHPNCDCGRFLEIGNSVFMQYQKQKDGSLKTLAQKNVDFGGGLERITAASQNEPDIFKTDCFRQLIQVIEKYTPGRYTNPKDRQAMRIIADHMKAAVMLITDGVIPSNKAQGYILRRLLRRAAVKINSIGGGLTPIPAIEGIGEEVLRMYDGQYVNRVNIREKVFSLMGGEITKFGKSLDSGLKILEKTPHIDGKIAFDLYQSYGFPLEITQEILTQKGITFDVSEFKKQFEHHQNLSRTSSKGMFKGGLADKSEMTTRLHTATHLLQQSLRTILGSHVRQKGSHITAERLRFDFTHPQKLTEEEINKIEKLVNEKIKENLPVTLKITTLAEAIKEGAMTVPGANYPEKVNVYSIGNFSKEVCGGPHVGFTQALGSFKIMKEEGVSAGTRRVYAILK